MSDQLELTSDEAMKPLYIFDLDGTLALIEHRRKYVERPRGEQDWKAFYAACVDDHPNDPVIDTMERLREAGADVWIFSGRSDEVRAQTVKWLADKTTFMSWELDGPMLTMRQAGDYTPETPEQSLPVLSYTIEVTDAAQVEGLLDAAGYQSLVDG